MMRMSPAVHDTAEPTANGGEECLLTEKNEIIFRFCLFYCKFFQKVKRIKKYFFLFCFKYFLIIAQRNFLFRLMNKIGKRWNREACIPSLAGLAPDSIFQNYIPYQKSLKTNDGKKLRQRMEEMLTNH